MFEFQWNALRHGVLRHVIVLGGGYVGLELSQAIRRFGSRVTVIEAGPQLASREDPDVGAALLDLFVDEGIEVLLGTEVHQVEGHSGDRVRVHMKERRGERTIEGTDLLVAVGRKANTEGIGFERTGVELNEHGYIRADERLQTTSANIWAMGDCAGSPQFTHVAFDDFRIVYDNLKGGSRTTKNRLIPFCMFNRSGTGTGGQKRVRGAARRNRISPGENAVFRGAPNPDDLRAAWPHQDADRQEQR